MAKIAARLLIALGLTLVGLGKRLERRPPAARRTIALPRRAWRVRNPSPRRWWVDTFVPVAAG